MLSERYCCIGNWWKTIVKNCCYNSLGIIFRFIKRTFYIILLILCIGVVYNNFFINFLYIFFLSNCYVKRCWHFTDKSVNDSNTKFLLLISLSRKKVYFFFLQKIYFFFLQLRLVVRWNEQKTYLSPEED